MKRSGGSFLCKTFCQNGSTECPAHTAATGETNRDGRDQAYCHVIENTVAKPLVQLYENGLGVQQPPGS